MRMKIQIMAILLLLLLLSKVGVSVKDENYRQLRTHARISEV